MKYCLKKILNKKPYSYYNQEFKTINEAILALNSWMEFDAALFQAQGEKNVLYTISINDYNAELIKIKTTKENISFLLKNMNSQNIEPKKYLENKEKIKNILTTAKQKTIFKYVLEGCQDDFKLPKINNDKMHLIIYKNNLLIESNFIKTELNMSDFSEDKAKMLLEFTKISEKLGNIFPQKYNCPIILKLDEKTASKCYVTQKDEIICTMQFYPVSTKEILI